MGTATAKSKSFKPAFTTTILFPSANFRHPCSSAQSEPSAATPPLVTGGTRSECVAFPSREASATPQAALRG
ncbi:hypothetical protein CC2G_008702 [Coprinopsis cinerea AmutBmut pab1-1]|nr:hypothetical protein CC2G_008702 [Coprinopsis cinerea AmutBmut pab1-1]